MNATTICQIDGDGIGQEVVPVGTQLLQRVLPELRITSAAAGWGTFQQTGNSVPDETLDAIRTAGAAIFGAVSSPSQKVAGYQSAILKIRQSLGLNANIRPVDSRFGSRSDAGFRFVVVRENSEGLYARIENTDGDRATALKVVTRLASAKIGRSALRIARLYQLPRITIVHKANILPASDGLFRNTVRDEIASLLQSDDDIVVDELLVDTAALKIVEDPEHFGVIVTTNLYGDILSDVASYWCGGLALAPSLNLGEGLAVCEPVHGSAPDIAGKGLADPRATVLSLALLCRLFWQDSETADLLENAVHQSLEYSHLESAKTADITDQLLATLSIVTDSS